MVHLLLLLLCMMNELLHNVLCELSGVLMVEIVHINHVSSVMLDIIYERVDLGWSASILTSHLRSDSPSTKI